MYGQEVTFSGLPDELRTRRRRLLLLVIGLIVLLAAGLVAMLALAPDGRPAPGAGTGELGSAPLEPNIGRGSEPATPAPTEGPTKEPGGGGPSGEGGQGPGNGDNTPDQPSGPCANWDRKLIGAPDDVRLGPGVTEGSFTIHNCTDEAVAWTAAAKSSVAIEDAQGSVEPGGSFVLNFTFDPSTYDTYFMFRIGVKDPTTAAAFFYVEVHGSREVIAGN
jgi:hypothetical protein